MGNNINILIRIIVFLSGVLSIIIGASYFNNETLNNNWFSILAFFIGLTFIYYSNKLTFIKSKVAKDEKYTFDDLGILENGKRLLFWNQLKKVFVSIEVDLTSLTYGFILVDSELKEHYLNEDMQEWDEIQKTHYNIYLYK